MDLPLTRAARTPRKPRRTPQWVEVLPFLLPGIVLFVAFILWPLAQGLRMSLYNWNIMPGAEQEFIGLGNFGRIFTDPIVRIALRNTLLYVVVSVPGQMFFGMLVALALNSAITGKTMWRAIYYLPTLTGWLVVSYIFKYLFNSGGSPINYIFHDVLHLLPHHVGWFQDPWTAQVPIILQGVWKGIGWTMVMFLAGLQSIPQELFEAAAIDGADSRQSFWNVTVPLMRPVVLFVLVMLTIGSFNVGLHVMILTGGGPMNQTSVIVSYMYDQGFKYFDFGYGSAIAVLLGILMFGIAMVQNRLLKSKTEM